MSAATQPPSETQSPPVTQPAAISAAACAGDRKAAIPAGEWERACALVLDAERIVLTTHAGPDGDGIGSMVGLCIALRALGKTAAMVCADPAPPDLLFLPDASRVQVADALDGLPLDPDLIIVCDAASLPRLGAVYAENQSHFTALPVLNLDHHQTNTCFGAVNLVDTTAAATAEIAHALLERLRVVPTPATATALMTGLVTDTLGFRTDSVTPRTLALAAHLLAHGAPLHDICDRVFHATRYEKLKIWGYALANLQRTADGRIAWTTIPRETRRELGAKESDLSGLASLIEGMEGADIVIIAWDKRKDPNRTQVSLRARAVSAAAIAQTLGGGGHARAAGALLHAPLAVGLRKALEAAQAHLE